MGGLGIIIWVQPEGCCVCRRSVNQAKVRDALLLFLGVSISAVMVLLFPKLYHEWDVPSFIRWAADWGSGWRDIYVRCQACNYPIVGLFSSAGMIHLLGLTYNPNAALFFRLWLAAVDGANVLLLYGLLKKFSIPNPAATAGVLGLLVSTWAGGALWGQIDDVSQFFLLLTLLWMVSRILSPGRHFAVYVAVSSLLLALLVLTKQLIIFSFLSVELLLLTSIFLRRKWLSALGYAGLHLSVFLFFVFVWDLFLHPVDGYLSHLQLIWGERSPHGGLLSANGINLWMLLPRDPASSSSLPFSVFRNTPWETIITPVNIGWFLFAALAALITLSTLLAVRKRIRGGGGLDKEMLLNFVLHLAILNLCFNVVLTGTHERYLYHFYQFVILAFLGLQYYSDDILNIPLAGLILGSTLYGGFVLGVLWGTFAFRNYWGHQILAVLHAILLCGLILVALKYQGFAGNLRELWKGSFHGSPEIPGGGRSQANDVGA
jgi:hypothetical protein